MLQTQLYFVWFTTKLIQKVLKCIRDCNNFSIFNRTDQVYLLQISITHSTFLTQNLTQFDTRPYDNLNKNKINDKPNKCILLRF